MEKSKFYVSWILYFINKNKILSYNAIYNYLIKYDKIIFLSWCQSMSD